MICNNANNCSATTCIHKSSHTSTSRCGTPCFVLAEHQAVCVPESPPSGAHVELTVFINKDVWLDQQVKGMSSIDIERELKQELVHSLTHDKDRKLVEGIDELHVRKYL